MAIRNIDNNIYTIPKTIEILGLPITGAYNSSVTCTLSLFNNSVSLSINTISCTSETNDAIYITLPSKYTIPNSNTTYMFYILSHVNNVTGATSATYNVSTGRLSIYFNKVYYNNYNIF